MHSGKRGKHTAVRLLRADKKAITAPNLSRLGIYCPTPTLDADLSELHRPLKAYWRANGLDGGVPRDYDDLLYDDLRVGG